MEGRNEPRFGLHGAADALCVAIGLSFLPILSTGMKGEHSGRFHASTPTQARFLHDSWVPVLIPLREDVLDAEFLSIHGDIMGEGHTIPS